MLYKIKLETFSLQVKQEILDKLGLSSSPGITLIHMPILIPDGHKQQIDFQVNLSVFLPIDLFKCNIFVQPNQQGLEAFQLSSQSDACHRRGSLPEFQSLLSNHVVNLSPCRKVTNAILVLNNPCGQIPFIYIYIYMRACYQCMTWAFQSGFWKHLLASPVDHKYQYIQVQNEG